MKISIIIAFLVVLIGATGCSKTEIQGGIVISTGFTIRVKNATGKNLLDPSTPNYYQYDKIKLYRLVNGERKDVTVENLVKTYSIINEKGDYLLSLSGYQGLNEDSMGNSVGEVIVAWTEGNEDTFQTEINRVNNVYMLRKVWHSNTLKYNYYTSGDDSLRTVEIVK